MKPKIGANLIFILLIGLSFILSGCSKVNKEKATTQASSCSDAVYYNDGPYVFWKGGSATVKFVCQGEQSIHEYGVINSTEIVGLCFNSLQTFSIEAKAPIVEADTFVDVQRIVAVGDLHGNLKPLIDLLVGNGIIDAQHHWIAGEDHLIITGDIFDRGPKVTETLWFVHQLEQKALRSGGRVHLLLGNHEIMILQGDDRYLHDKYSQVTCPVLGADIKALFGPETELGRWLRTKHVIVRVNGILFAHAGLSPALVVRGLSISTINQKVRDGIDKSRTTHSLDGTLRLLYGPEGPFWYRGYMSDSDHYEVATRDEVRSILEFYKAEAVVVGHTIVDQITVRFGGRVFAIDTGIYKRSTGEALVWEDGKFYCTDTNGHCVILHSNGS